MIRVFVKRLLQFAAIDPKRMLQFISFCSLNYALKNQGLNQKIERLREIVPDISKQESRENLDYNEVWELKRRGMHSFQTDLMEIAVKDLKQEKITVVDIGDSAGTHMLYLKALINDKYNIETVSVNLDPRAIKKIISRGMKAVLKRAEDITPEDIGGREVDLFTSFEMVEHLHNPAIFFRRLALKTSCERILITVPYLRQSRVGLHHIRYKSKEVIYAEDEHIFELSPEDWTLLFLHSGWKVVYKRIYYQYPNGWPIISSIFRFFWRWSDYEGFWGALLEKDMTYSKLYNDWEE